MKIVPEITIEIPQTVSIEDITEVELLNIRKRIKQEITSGEVNETMSVERKRELSALKVRRFGPGVSWLDFRVTTDALNNGQRTHASRWSL